MGRGKRKKSMPATLAVDRHTVGEHDEEGRAIAEEHTVLRVLVGSTVHGLAVGGTDDRDEMAIACEPPERALGTQRFEHWIYRTQPEGERSGPGDLDLSVYALHKFAKLCLGGNPTVMLPLFVDDRDCLAMDDVGRELRANAPLFASRQAGDRFIGYLRAQRERLLGERGQMNVHRPELVEAYGYDTKFGSHAIRLGYQGIEYLTTGRLTLPMSEQARTHIIAIRTGQISLAEVVAEAEELEQELKRLRDKADMPEHPDYVAANALIARLYIQHWREKGLI